MPSGVASTFTPAITWLEVDGMFQKIQCVTSIVPLAGAASVSCRITAKLMVFAGGLLHWIAGDAPLGSAQVNCVGICEPSAYAVALSLNLEGGGAACCCAAIRSAPAMSSAVRTATNSISLDRI